MQNLIPLPSLIRPGQGTYTLHPNVAIFVRPDQEKRRWEDYCPRLANHGPRLAAMGIKFYRSPQMDWE